MFMINSMLLWWPLDSVPLLLLVMKPKIVKGSATTEIRAASVNQTELTSELNLQCNLFLPNSTFVRKTVY